MVTRGQGWIPGFDVIEYGNLVWKFEGGMAHRGIEVGLGVRSFYADFRAGFFKEWNA
jgi:hypothetical protein